jgi:hypothetical protein
MSGLERFQRMVEKIRVKRKGTWVMTATAMTAGKR